MKANPIRLVLAAVALGATASAQETSSAPDQKAAATEVSPLAAASPAAPSDSPAPPKRPRAVSSEVAAILATGMPKYNPPPPPVEKKPEEEADLRDTDKPKNGIVRLPSFVVQDKRIPIFREADLYNEKGLSKLAMKKYSGLNVPLIGFLNRPIALEMYREDQRITDIDELRKEASDAKQAGDAAGSDYIRRTAAETFVHRSDFGGTIPGQQSP